MIESFEIEGGVTLRGYRTSGSRPGPHVLITAGIHGSEYPGILAARKLRAFLAEADIADRHGPAALQSISPKGTRQGDFP